jgi:hypothetical protein
MVFGEPDIDVKKDKEGKISVEIKGLDVYDPTTPDGQFKIPQLWPGQNPPA